MDCIMALVLHSNSDVLYGREAGGLQRPTMAGLTFRVWLEPTIQGGGLDTTVHLCCGILMDAQHRPCSLA